MTPSSLLQQQQKEFEETFDDVYWAEVLAEARMGDIDGKYMKAFMEKSHIFLISCLEEWAKENAENMTLDSGADPKLIKLSDLLEFLKA